MVIDEVFGFIDLSDFVVIGADAGEEGIGADIPTGRLGEMGDSDRMAIGSRRRREEPLHDRGVEI